MVVLGLDVVERAREDRQAAFLVSVDRIEELSGLDFFPELGEPTQTRLEAAEPTELWEDNPR